VCPSAREAECLNDEDVSEFVEGVLSGERQREMEQHLAQCSACAELVQGVAGVAPQVSPGHAPRSADAPLARGDRVGRYEILGWIGAGAMGSVYAAHDPALDRKVALKLLRAHIATPQLEARLLREAKAMARLSYPEIVSVFDAGRHGERLFIAMEFVRGGTLRTWLKAEPRTWQKVLSVFLRAGHGLAQAHAAGIVHRDFKPDNVLVGDDGRVRVTDFGLARAESAVATTDADADPRSQRAGDAAQTSAALTRTGALVGTPAYMAPEQLSGETADASSDIYSFCVALYEGLYSVRPFEGATTQELLAARLTGKPLPPPHASRVPQRVRRVVLAGLRARPEERPASMTELLRALEAAAKAPRRPLAIAVGVGLAASGLLAFSRRTPRSEPSAALASAASRASSSASAGAGDSPCATSRQCAERHGGEPWICRASDGACVSVASEDCAPRFEAGDAVADDTVWLGALFPMRGPKAKVYGAMSLEGVDLARKEIAQATRALEGPTASLHVRRIALAACDDSEDPMRAARHLVDDVGVPAVLGFGSGQEVVDVAGGLLIRRGVLSVASVTPSPLVTRLPQPADLPPMVWRTTFNLDDVARATAQFIHEWLEPRVPHRASTTRVALARDDTSSAVSFGDALYKQLVFNDRPAAENGAAYQEVTFAPELEATAVERLADRLVTMAPTFVVLLAASPQLPVIVGAIEARWQASYARPSYLIPNNSLASLADSMGIAPDRRLRVFAIASDSSSPQNARFVMRYNEAHAEQVTLVLNPAASYDAFYVAAYAVHSLGAAAVTGPDIARAFHRLVPPGEPVEVGPTPVFDALRRLASGQQIDLQGAASGLDFDLATGEVSSDFTLVCLAVDGAGRATGDDLESGVVFRARSGRVTGTLRCR
jgi:serine/threonine protein kinase/ABC-type branched-subunit amino acid transport system substrate-binding protein